MVALGMLEEVGVGGMPCSMLIVIWMRREVRNPNPTVRHPPHSADPPHTCHAKGCPDRSSDLVSAEKEKKEERLAYCSGPYCKSPCPHGEQNPP